MEPLGSPFDHPLAFCGELAKVGGEHRRCDDRARHGDEEEIRTPPGPVGRSASFGTAKCARQERQII